MGGGGFDAMTLDAVRDLIVASLSGEPPADVWDAVPLEEAPLTE